MIFGPYPATVLNVHDGDTIALDIDLGFGIHHTGLHCRVYGINAPELKTAAGKVARDYAKSLLPEGTQVTVHSHGWDKYGGRFDGDIQLPGRGGDFGTLMLDAGQAIPLETT